MRRIILKFKCFTIILTIITIIIGCLAHFAFSFFNNAFIVSIFCPVNESTWEHLKLLYFPMLFISLIGYPVYKLIINKSNLNNPNSIITLFTRCYIIGLMRSLIYGILFIVIAFYTLKGILGHSVEWANIAIYAAAVILSFITFYKYLSLPLNNTYIYNSKACNNLSDIKNICRPMSMYVSLFIIIVIGGIFILFTFIPPKLPLFMDTSTGNYGIHF